MWFMLMTGLSSKVSIPASTINQEYSYVYPVAGSSPRCLIYIYIVIKAKLDMLFILVISHHFTIWFGMIFQTYIEG